VSPPKASDKKRKEATGFAAKKPVSEAKKVKTAVMPHMPTAPGYMGLLVPEARALAPPPPLSALAPEAPAPPAPALGQPAAPAPAPFSTPAAPPLGVPLPTPDLAALYGVVGFGGAIGRPVTGPPRVTVSGGGAIGGGGSGGWLPPGGREPGSRVMQWCHRGEVLEPVPHSAMPAHSLHSPVTMPRKACKLFDQLPTLKRGSVHDALQHGPQGNPRHMPRIRRRWPTPVHCTLQHAQEQPTGH
jgi:hypothetical protein